MPRNHRNQRYLVNKLVPEIAVILFFNGTGFEFLFFLKRSL
jgi:hypothetical protein